MSIFNIKKNVVPRSVFTNPVHFIACGFGVGAMPFAPGTFGTGLGVLCYYLLFHLLSHLSSFILVYIFIAVILFIIGIVITGITNRDFGVHDHPATVWDEVVGFLFVMIAMPNRWYFVLLGFILFRLFDIWKPWPIKKVEQLPGGLGVMADDLVAAVYAWIALFFVFLR